MDSVMWSKIWDSWEFGIFIFVFSCYWHRFGCENWKKVINIRTGLEVEGIFSCHV